MADKITYTKEQLQGMTDLEINQILTAFVLGNPWLDFGELVNDGKEFHVANAIGDPFYCEVINYCGNPSHIMPLAFEYRICLLSSPNAHGDKWASVWNEVGGKWSVDDVTFYDENPLRAIVCCLILVLQDKEQP